MNIETILVPTDFSENADRAFVTAIQFARAFDARIQLLHVYDISDTTTIYEVTFPTGVVDGEYEKQRACASKPSRNKRRTRESSPLLNSFLDRQARRSWNMRRDRRSI